MAGPWEDLVNALEERQVAPSTIIGAAALIAQLLLWFAGLSALSSELLGAVKLIRALVLVTLLSTTAFTVVTALQTRSGDAAFQISYVVTNFFSKIATCAVLMALAPTKKHRLPTLLVELTALFWVVYSVYCISSTSATSVSTDITLSQEEKKLKLVDFWRGYLKFDMITDAGIVLSVINCVRSTTLPLQKRINIIQAFLPRILPILSAWVRWSQFQEVALDGSNSSSEKLLYVMATALQVFWAVLSALAPHLPPFRNSVLASWKIQAAGEAKQKGKSGSSGR